ncbi:MAG: hypothetical protein D3913_14565 [Candidatus Electrothrix sp. LOE1_4_5]|nr:hypothetical protein [Candidatus Electrothrix gigas]
MINFVLEKFEKDKELRLFYAEQYQFIMLDEFQDTNNAQNEIVNLILGESIDHPLAPSLVRRGDKTLSLNNSEQPSPLTPLL